MKMRTEVICRTCMHHCRLKEGQTGRCRARKNIEGKVVCANYGRLTSMALDPIEKKPLKRFHPGSRILSVGSYGCNLSCPFCQNHQISMAGEDEIQTVFLSPRELCEKALETVPLGNIGVAFTYNEPMIGYEYIRDTAVFLKKEHLIVPEENDQEEEMEEMAKWIADIDPNIPLHVTRFFPNWQMQDRPPTEVDMVYHLARIAGKHLKYVYTGNC